MQSLLPGDFPPGAEIGVLLVQGSGRGNGQRGVNLANGG
jgi:hypothetical protein